MTRFEHLDFSNSQEDGDLPDLISLNVACREEVQNGGISYDTYADARSDLVTRLKYHPDDFAIFCEALAEKELPDALRTDIVPRKFWDDIAKEVKDFHEVHAD